MFINIQTWQSSKSFYRYRPSERPTKSKTQSDSISRKNDTVEGYK